jgi:ABC-type proline/glycine betaine transport system permease subunit
MGKDEKKTVEEANASERRLRFAENAVWGFYLLFMAYVALLMATQAMPFLVLLCLGAIATIALFGAMASGRWVEVFKTLWLGWAGVIVAAVVLLALGILAGPAPEGSSLERLKAIGLQGILCMLSATFLIAAIKGWKGYLTQPDQTDN